MMYSAVRSSSPVSTNAEKILKFNRGRKDVFRRPASSETRTDKNVMIGSDQVEPECSASDKTPKLPVRMTRKP